MRLFAVFSSVRPNIRVALRKLCCLVMGDLLIMLDMLGYFQYWIFWLKCNTLFLYKNQLYKNSEPQNGSKIKNNLRTNRGSKRSRTKKIEY